MTFSKKVWFVIVVLMVALISGAVLWGEIDILVENSSVTKTEAETATGSASEDGESFWKIFYISWIGAFIVVAILFSLIALREMRNAPVGVDAKEVERNQTLLNDLKRRELMREEAAVLTRYDILIPFKGFAVTLEYLVGRVEFLLERVEELVAQKDNLRADPEGVEGLLDDDLRGRVQEILNEDPGELEKVKEQLKKLKTFFAETQDFVQAMGDGEELYDMVSMILRPTMATKYAVTLISKKGEGTDETEEEEDAEGRESEAEVDS